MKLVIQIPCLNETATIGATIDALPAALPGIDVIEVLVIDDGSTDTTVETARAHGAHVVRHTRNLGLARAFMTGLQTALTRGADVIVNTDADHQYQGAGVARLVAPILDQRAALVLGCRPIERIPEFGWWKKRLQRLGSRVVRRLSGANIPDATTGFRAYTRDAALRLCTHTNFTYTIETLIQAGHEGIHLAWVPVEVNPQTRPSRLFRSNFQYVKHALAAMVRVYLVYRAFQVFSTAGFWLLMGALVLGARFLWSFIASGGQAGHVQSLILAAVLTIVAIQAWVLGAVSDMIAANRRLLAETLAHTRRRALATGAETGHPVLPPTVPFRGTPLPAAEAAALTMPGRTHG